MEFPVAPISIFPNLPGQFLVNGLMAEMGDLDDGAMGLLKSRECCSVVMRQ